MAVSSLKLVDLIQIRHHSEEKGPLVVLGGFILKSELLEYNNTKAANHLILKFVFRYLHSR